ncbi:hypothetical protein DY000_02055851 [Brassica cretica]|uniref:Uncharacterized protein n=1 Tax=Brassica cretica TaxID=69181 RepID=A0ABQ7A6Y3_BRACR|nr:hypothetical protein DY000_02055851 [Brassica cretica]
MKTTQRLLESSVDVCVGILGVFGWIGFVNGEAQESVDERLESLSLLLTIQSQLCKPACNHYSRRFHSRNFFHPLFVDEISRWFKVE